MTTKAVRDWVRAQFGAKSLISTIVILASLVPDWMSRFQFWREIAISAFHKPWFPLVIRLVIILCGVAVIVSDYRAHLRAGHHNITSTKAETTPILYSATFGRFDREANPPHSKLAILLEVINIADRRKKVQGIGKVRAQIKFELGDWHRVFAPCAWVSEYFSSVDLGPGETRELIVAMRNTAMGTWADWRAVTNRRGNSGEAISVNFQQEIAPFRDGTILVELISCDFGTVVARFELGWQQQSADGITGGVTYVKQLS
jgi:hypothetical protein